MAGFKLDLDTLTVGEAKELEKSSGLSIGAILKKLGGDDYSIELVSHIMLVLARRGNPDATMDDIDSVNLLDLDVSAVPPQMEEMAS